MTNPTTAGPYLLDRLHACDVFAEGPARAYEKSKDATDRGHERVCRLFSADHRIAVVLRLRLIVYLVHSAVEALLDCKVQCSTNERRQSVEAHYTDFQIMIGKDAVWCDYELYYYSPQLSRQNVRRHRKEAAVDDPSPRNGVVGSDCNPGISIRGKLLY